MSTVLRGFALDRQVDFWMREVNPAWSLSGLRARVVDVLDETHDVKTFVLRPNSHWRGYRAGQFVTVEVEINGVRTARCYSLSSSPGGRRCAITVKRVPGGRVSSWLHDHVRPGHVLVLGPPSGDFVMPRPTPEKLLFLSGGSGVTPVMSILRDLLQKNELRDAVFLHAARSARDVIFRDELERLVPRKGLRVAIILEDLLEGFPVGWRLDPTPLGGRLDAAKLRKTVPDFEQRETFLCGPPGMLDALTPIWTNAGIARRLKVERFLPAPPPALAAGETRSQLTVTLARSGRRVKTETAGTLLQELERAGERPAHGCRMGICNTCRCRKRAGSVENTLTGAVSNAPDEEIRLCVSRARTDLELWL